MFREEIPYEEIQIKYIKDNWEIGFGLQAIDGLKPSDYLVELAGKQITDKISYEEVYLNTSGFELNKEPFKNHSKYFRDSLSLANANRMIRTDKYLRMFTDNIILGGTHELVIKHEVR